MDMPSGTPTSPDEREDSLAPLREKLAATQGRAYWRGLEELADTEEFRSFLNAEFPSAAEELTSGVDRRRFLKLMGASLALAGVSACTRQPTEKILPYVEAPEQIIPGEPLYYASAFGLAGVAMPVLVESHMGRPTKIEGNPEHPASLGKTHTLTQATVLDLYDPDRAQVFRRAGEIRTWPEYAREARRVVEELKETRGKGLRLLTGTVTSPSMGRQIDRFLEEFPLTRWYQWEPVSHDNVREGAQIAFGDRVDPVFDFKRADIVVSLESDFLYSGPGAVRYAAEFAKRRKPDSKRPGMNRLYVAESTPTITGGAADHRLPLSPDQVADFALALAARLGVDVADPASMNEHAKWIAAVAEDLESNRGQGLVVAGESLPAEIHAVVFAINDALGNTGRTVSFINPIDYRHDHQTDSLTKLVEEINAGEVDGLLILGGNPVYDAPADLEFAQALSKVRLSTHLSTHYNETSQLCLWHIPESHYLESWGDLRAFDGTLTVQQPLIDPLYGTKSAVEVLAALTGQADPVGYDLVRDAWKAREQADGEAFEVTWRKAVHDGMVADSAHEHRTMRLRSAWKSAVRTRLKARVVAQDGLTVVFRPDPNLFDGRFANNGWLQELPRPVTKLTWDNAALIAPATATRLGLENEAVVTLTVGERTLDAPVWIVPGQAANVITLHLGGGRRAAGNVGNSVGFDAYSVRTTTTLWDASGVTLAKTARTMPLATTQTHHSMEGRNLVRETDLASYREQPDFAQHFGHGIDEDASMFPNEHKYEGYSWGMTIDLSKCIGCNACSVACQSENNIPIVGPVEVRKGREMSWIRIDRYFEGDIDNPQVFNQPVTCMHCENAPCEVVCPVNATVHSSEGLNEMVYNRCVGTRYCSNNCPYKVRRFNFFLYQDWETESLKLQRNPDVTVRSRGVMEKCTYCVQRINGARITAHRDDRKIRDGEITTACQSACPSDAIVFGDLNDKKSRVSVEAADPRNYGLLSELGTRPRTTYLAAVGNPNPKLGRSKLSTPHGDGHTDADSIRNGNGNGEADA
ncbi:MAG: MoCo/4Fe-4S cofactor protein with predicted Tat translocation signal [Hyphomicrobiaceae bacterium]|jgi:MoCo/4Fe-4S cofactor protein with predicted Tat translocation signal